MYASRVQLVETRIKPALADGIWVVGDHTISSQAYQGVAAASMPISSAPSNGPCSATSNRI